MEKEIATDRKSLNLAENRKDSIILARLSPRQEKEKKKECAQKKTCC